MLDKETIANIRADFPPESIQVKKSFKDTQGNDTFLVGYRPQYVIERLNDAFGHDSWDFEIKEFGIDKSDTWCLGILRIYAIKYDPEAIDGPVIRKLVTEKMQFGTGKKNSGTDLGDAYKSAATNALEKCASLLDVGHKAYKGLEEVPDDHHYASAHKKSKATASAKSEAMQKKEELLELCKKHNISDNDSFGQLIKTVFKGEKKFSEIKESVEDLQQLIDYVEKNKAPF